jgi:hypothetical protein
MANAGVRSGMVRSVKIRRIVFSSEYRAEYRKDEQAQCQ